MGTIGLLEIAHVDYVSELSSSLTERVEEGLRSKGLHVVKPNAVVTDMQQAQVAAKHLVAKDVDGVILFLATWLECKTAMSALREIEHIPFALWGCPMIEVMGKMESTGSFVSYAMLKGSLDRLGLRYASIVGMPDDDQALEQAKTFAAGAYAYQRCKRASVGLIGYTSMSIYPGTFDHLLMRYRIGPEIIHMDTYTLIRRMETVEPACVEQALCRMRTMAKIDDDVPAEKLITAAKMFVALKSLCDEHGLDAMNVKCQYELSKEFGMTACVPLSLLAESGVVAACEGDIPVTVSMLMLSYLTGQIPAYADFLNINPDHTIKMSPCGIIPYSLGNSGEQRIRNFMKGVGFCGIQNSFVFKPGKVTLLRLVEKKADYGLTMAVGEGLPTELRQGLMPALDIALEKDPMELLEQAGGQHFALCYGDVSESILALARIWKVEVFNT